MLHLPLASFVSHCAFVADWTHGIALLDTSLYVEMLCAPFAQLVFGARPQTLLRYPATEVRVLHSELNQLGRNSWDHDSCGCVQDKNRTVNCFV